MSQPLILALFIAPKAGAPMERRDSVEVIAGIGIQGDRYATGAGAWSKATRNVPRHVTFIEHETIEAICASGLPLTPELTRRNVVTQGIALNDLVGKTFLIGGTRYLGVELCDPCARPGMLSRTPSLKTDLEAALKGRGGLRTQALCGGTIRVGDAILID